MHTAKSGSSVLCFLLSYQTLIFPCLSTEVVREREPEMGVPVLLERFPMYPVLGKHLPENEGLLFTSWAQRLASQETPPFFPQGENGTGSFFLPLFFV